MEKLDFSGLLANCSDKGRTGDNFNENGSMQTGWRYVNGVWNYFDLAGEMTTSWQKIDGIWYYMSESGVMQCGWQKIGGIWYFFEVSGAMDHDMWIQGVYYLKSSGAMAVSEWVDYNRYYVDEQGYGLLRAKKRTETGNSSCMAVIPSSVLFIFLFIFHFLQIFFRIFQKTECYHYDDGTNRKGCDDADRLQIAHRTFSK